MIKCIAEIYHKVSKKIEEKTGCPIYDVLILLICLSLGLVMIIRCFFGTEITDEAYYVADAKAMLEGNLPYAYCDYSFGSGSCFLLIPFIAIYKIFQPELTGIFLFSRLSFLFVWYVILFLIYKILCKSVRRCHALLFVTMLIPYKAGVVFLNFSYNTVPSILMLFVAFLLYDALENNSKYSFLEILISGFISGVAFLAQPGYGLAIFIFGLFLLIRSQGAETKIRNIMMYGIGGCAEVCVVFIPIIIQVGISTTVAGISRYFNAYPTNISMSEFTVFYRIKELTIVFGKSTVWIILVAVIIYALAARYVREKDQSLLKKEYVYMSIAAASCLRGYTFLRGSIYSDEINYKLGMLGATIFCMLFMLKAYEKYMLLLYVGIYPIVFTVLEIIGVDSGAVIERFTAVVPTLAICLLFFMEQKSEIIRVIATVMVVLCIVEIALGVGTFVYRDGTIMNLRVQVKEGVYKGIFTTEARARDLPALEKYLNQYIEDGEYYEFHDLVPCGYLMMHRGEVCSIATWDSLNYSYGRNAPAELYEYYKRRGNIPDKIFYVDFGRDKNLSIEDSDFKYNEFVETYYDKIDEVELNDTFFHVIVYKYNGEFDGDYNYWIDRHMVVPEG